MHLSEALVDRIPTILPRLEDEGAVQIGGNSQGIVSPFAIPISGKTLVICFAFRF